MQTEKKRERLVELLSNCQHEYDKEVISACAENRPFKRENSFYADYLIANGVTVEIKQEEMTKIIMDLLKYAKAINSVAVELQKDEYLYLLEYMEKAENVLKERKEKEK